MRHYTREYYLYKDGECIKFNSELDACRFLGVVKSSVSSCYRKNAKCKGYIIKRGDITSHCETKTRIHKIWSGMHERCNRKNHTQFKNYGGRGIRICDEWYEYENFRNWALQNGYTDELTIDRIDVNGDYSPQNCRWISRNQQATNKRTNHVIYVNGEYMIIAECSRKYGIPHSTIRWRLSHDRDILTGAKMDGRNRNNERYSF